MHHPVKARVGRVEHSPRRSLRECDDAVCKCDPGVHWTRSTESHRSGGSSEPPTTTWLLCHLVDSSAREPTTGVPSCDKPGGAARRRRTQDPRMGIPTAIASRNGERRELKHLSIGRKRKRNAMSSVTAREPDTAQTEADGFPSAMWCSGWLPSPDRRREVPWNGA